MASRFRVVWSEAAANDLADLVAYVAVDSPTSARTMLARLEKRAGSLVSSPQRGRRVPELARFGIGSWRELIVHPHRLVYEIDDRTVRVMAVLDGRRELQDLLLERSIRADR